MDPKRRAALALHGLEPVDRDWMLARMTPERRDMLQSLLDELKALGIPARRDLTDAALQRATGPSVPASEPAPVSVETTPESPAERIARTSPLVMRVVLAGEPAEIVARVLAAGDWPWANDYLGTCSPGHRHAVESIRATLPAAASLSAWFIDALPSRIAEAEVGTLELCAPGVVQEADVQTQDAPWHTGWDRLMRWIETRLAAHTRKEVTA